MRSWRPVVSEQRQNGCAGLAWPVLPSTNPPGQPARNLYFLTIVAGLQLSSIVSETDSVLLSEGP